jgi:hypothetical protein
MRNVKLTGLALAVGAVMGMACASAADAADASQTPAPGISLYGDKDTPNISGLWLGTAMGAPGAKPRTPDGRPITYWSPWPPPLTPAYQKRADERIAAARAGQAVGDNGSKCLPFGMPWVFTYKVYPDEIVQTPGAVTMLLWSTFPITIWTDGRGHPKDWKPTYNGHSIGYWQGDTLYVDTVGILDTTELDATLRTPHSAKLHMKTTIQRVAADTLHVHVTLYDEDALTEPMVTTSIWQRKSGPGWQVLDDASCFENNKNLPDAGGATGFVHF